MHFLGFRKFLSDGLATSLDPPPHFEMGKFPAPIAKRLVLKFFSLKLQELPSPGYILVLV